MRSPTSSKGSQSSRRTRSRAILSAFDGEGVRNALLAAVTRIYESAPQTTLPQLLVTLAIITAERDGRPHTLATLVEQLNMPYSTASRVVWSLTEEGGDLGIVRYQPHPTDRRKKYLVVNQHKRDTAISKNMMQAMIEYYGESVKMLERAG